MTLYLENLGNRAVLVGSLMEIEDLEERGFGLRGNAWVKSRCGCWEK